LGGLYIVGGSLVYCWDDDDTFSGGSLGILFGISRRIRSHSFPRPDGDFCYISSRHDIWPFTRVWSDGIYPTLILNMELYIYLYKATCLSYMQLQRMPASTFLLVTSFRTTN